VPLPNEKKAAGCFYSETYLDSSLTRWKAQLMAKGYSKMNGVNYQDTFSTVTKITSVRLLITVAATYLKPIH